MENKINIAELLKDCPKGMELDCTLCDNVTFAGIDDNNIVVERNSCNGNKIYLSKWGTFFGCNDAKCVIFPKGRNTWKEFAPPCEFKDGDIVATNTGAWVGITTGGKVAYLYQHIVLLSIMANLKHILVENGVLTGLLPKKKNKNCLTLLKCMAINGTLKQRF